MGFWSYGVIGGVPTVTFHRVHHASIVLSLSGLLMMFSRLTPMASWCSEPLLGLIALRPLASTTCSSMWLEPLLGGGMVFGLLARLPPIAALRSPLKECSTIVGDRSYAGTEVSKAKGNRPTDGGPDMAIG